MGKKVPPLKVSPIIRGGRYIFLLSGIVYGMMKLSAFRAYEATAKTIREKMYQEEHLREHEATLRNFRSEMKSLAEQMELTDLPAGWEQDIE